MPRKHPRPAARKKRERIKAKMARNADAQRTRSHRHTAIIATPSTGLALIAALLTVQK